MSDRVLVIVPDLQRGGEPRADPRPAARRVPDGARAGRRRRLARTAPASSPRSWPPPIRACTSLHRTAKAGLGPAYVAGFRWAREHGYDVVVEMDADGSHAPEQLPQLLDALARPTSCSAPATCPGERWPTGRCTGCCSRARATATRAGRCGCRCSDATGGYRAARGELIDALPFDDVASQGYCFQVDWAWRAVRRAPGCARYRSRSPSGRSAGAR